MKSWKKEERFVHICTTLLTKRCKYDNFLWKIGGGSLSTLKAIRLEKGLTQKQASKIIGVSLRTYKSYENDNSKIYTAKYKYMLELIRKYVILDEEHGLLSLDEIKNGCKCVLEEYPVRYCILFGSYSKGSASEKSDVDLLISTEATGLSFYNIIERLTNVLHKKVDLLDVRELINDYKLLDDILNDGIKVYEKSIRKQWFYKVGYNKI